MGKAPIFALQQKCRRHPQGCHCEFTSKGHAGTYCAFPCASSSLRASMSKSCGAPSSSACRHIAAHVGWVCVFSHASFALCHVHTWKCCKPGPLASRLLKLHTDKRRSFLKPSLEICGSSLIPTGFCNALQLAAALAAASCAHMTPGLMLPARHSCRQCQGYICWQGRVHLCPLLHRLQRAHPRS